jgi:peptidoglycan-associated lipoprotein
MMRRFLMMVPPVLLLTSACAKRPVPLGPTPTPRIVRSDSADRAREDSIARADSMRRAEEAREQARERAAADSASQIRAREERDATRNADATGILAAKVYFDFDQSMLSDAAKSLLSAKVPVLQAHPDWRLRITGHTDERGSSEYNLALGLRRAAEAKAFLVTSGVDAGRIEILSMGEEQPAVQGSGEEAWSRNRRDEFAPITQGADR